MPATKRRYYSTNDIMEILGISKSKANAIMHMFEYQGKLLREGKLMRVEVSVFEKWLEEKAQIAACEPPAWREFGGKYDAGTN